MVTKDTHNNLDTTLLKGLEIFLTIVKNSLHVFIAMYVDAVRCGIIVNIGSEEYYHIEQLLSRILKSKSQNIQWVMGINLDNTDNLHTGLALISLISARECCAILD